LARGWFGDYTQRDLKRTVHQTSLIVPLSAYVLPIAENRSGKPILYFQTTNSFERVYVGSHDRGASCASVRGDRQIVAANRLSRRFQSRADSAV
jgi:hypothetical protein